MPDIQPTGDPLYALEKLLLAVHSLAVGEGNIKSRLYSAFMEFHPVSERDIPPELVEDYRWIRRELTKRASRSSTVVNGAVRHGVDGRVGATLKTMRTATAVEIAERICRLSDRLVEIVRREFRGEQRSIHGCPVVPRNPRIGVE